MGKGEAGSSAEAEGWEQRIFMDKEFTAAAFVFT